MTDTCNTKKRLKHLIKLLASMPDVTVHGKCGGHKNPEPGELPEDQFHVLIRVPPTPLGFAMLGIITMATMRLDDFKVLAWVDGEQVEDLSFIIRGFDGADPDDLGRMINTITREQLERDPKQLCHDCKDKKVKAEQQ